MQESRWRRHCQLSALIAGSSSATFSVRIRRNLHQKRIANHGIQDSRANHQRQRVTYRRRCRPGGTASAFPDGLSDAAFERLRTTAAGFLAPNPDIMCGTCSTSSAAAVVLLISSPPALANPVDGYVRQALAIHAPANRVLSGRGYSQIRMIDWETNRFGAFDRNGSEVVLVVEPASGRVASETFIHWSDR